MNAITVLLIIRLPSRLSRIFRSALLLSTLQKFPERTWRALQVLSRFSGEESSPKTLHVRSSEYHIFNIFLNSLEINIFRTYLNRIFDYKYDVLVSKLVCNICNNFFLPESLLGEFLSAPWAGKFLRSTLQIHLERKLRLSGKNQKVSEESSPRRVQSTSLQKTV